jgi:hypothetical protein
VRRRLSSRSPARARLCDASVKALSVNVASKRPGFEQSGDGKNAETHVREITNLGKPDGAIPRSGWR